MGLGLSGPSVAGSEKARMVPYAKQNGSQAMEGKVAVGVCVTSCRRAKARPASWLLKLAYVSAASGKCLGHGRVHTCMHAVAVQKSDGASVQSSPPFFHVLLRRLATVK